MKSYDYEAVAFDGAVYCVECLPAGTDPDDPEVSPVFADSEWDHYPVCDACGTIHDYITLTDDGIFAELDANKIELFQHPEAYALGDDHEPGWYYWTCSPGCLPDSDPCGPFRDEMEAARDALNL